MPEIFHNLQPHPALKASPESERLYLKLLSSGVLAVILPTEDLHSDCERTLIREILSGLGFFNIADKLSEPFLLYEIITKVLTSLKPAETNTPPSPESAERVETPPVDLNTKEVLRKRKRNRREDGKASPKPPQSPSAAPPRTTPPSPNTKTIKDTCFEHAEVIANYLGRGIQILSTTISFVISVVQNPPPLPPPSPSARRRKPILRMSLLKFISNLLRINSKQPWLRGNILLALSSLSSRPTRSLVDK